METYKKIELYIENGDIKAAEKLLSEIKLNKGISLYYNAEITRMKGLVLKSIKLFKKALIYNISLEYRFKIFIKLISLLRTIGNVKEAKRYLSMAEKLKPYSDEFLIEKAMVLRLLEKYEEALKIFNYLKKSYLSKKDYQAVSYILWAEGGVYRNMGEILKSIKTYQESIRYAKVSNDDTLVLYSTLGLAGSVRIAGMLKRSLRLYSKCIEKSPTDDYFAKAYSYCGTANALRQIGKFGKALKYYRYALKYYTFIKDNPDTALVLWGMAECYKRYNLNKALKYVCKAKKYLKDTHEIRGKILVTLTESYIRYALGEKLKANKLFYNAIVLSKRHKLNTLMETFG